jgi:DNA (cytosine-5)-methyltransferase 1
MKVLSLFSGVGGFDMGLENAGMETVYQCEWDKHCLTILDKHWPDVPKWDDISTLTGKHILAGVPVIDVVAWGSPCQDLSVAGKRAGLEGGRSNLFYEGIRIIKELRKETNGQYPRISIWENVVGALNSNKGADFGVILDEMAEAGALVIEWTVLDAQYWVPQRRKRVFVIAIFDPAIANICPDPLLPVSESLPGHLAKGKPARQSASTKIADSIGTDGEWWDGRDTAEALTTTSNEQRMPDKHRFQAVVEQGVVGALAARDYKGVNHEGARDGKLIVEPYASSSFAQYEQGVGTLRSNGGDLGGGSETLLLDGTRVNDVRVYEPPVQTLKERMGTGGNNVPMLAFDTQFGSNANVTEDVAPTPKSSQAPQRIVNAVFETTMAVRRLTPLECERLMGWPDDHTRYKADGTEQADTHRYKQCGNGVASPVAQWIGKHLIKLGQQ